MSRFVNETLAEFLEKAQRPGLLGLVGKSVQKRCTADLKTYFSALGKRITEMKLEELAHADRGASEEHARHAVEMRLHNLLRQRQPFLRAVLHVNILSAIEAAGKVGLLAEADLDGDDEQLGMTADQAADYASKQLDDVLPGIDATTMQSVADAVGTGISQQLGVSGTAKLIRDVVDGMSSWRSEMIAATQMNDAMSQAFLLKLVNNAVDYKQWILGPNPCADCEENADASPIPVDEDFRRRCAAGAPELRLRAGRRPGAAMKRMGEDYAGLLLMFLLFLAALITTR